MTVDLKRMALYFALMMVCFSLWQAWQMDNASKVASQTATSKPNQATISNDRQQVDSAYQQSSQTNKPMNLSISPKSSLIHVKTNTLDLSIDPIGGRIVDAKLLMYPEKLYGDEPTHILTSDNGKLYVAESGVKGFGATREETPTYRVISNIPDAGGQDIILQATLANGVQLQKEIRIKKDDYVLGVKQTVNNLSSEPLSGSLYTEIARQQPPKSSSWQFLGISSYMGAAISTPPEKLYKKVTFPEMKKADLNEKVTAGWVAMLQHYFLSAWIPDDKQHSVLYSKVQESGDNSIYIIGARSADITLEPQQSHSFSSKLYVGPIDTDILETVAPGLDLTIDYGIFWVFSKPIFYVLKTIYDVVGNWGWAIILVTLLMKAAFYHLSAKGYRSMAKMRDMQPKVEALRERYKDNKEMLSKAMMELYSKEKVSPLGGGCLPMLIQFPIFIALYWVLIESVELRHAPFILWIHDLSAKDPYFILPILMGISMFAQQKMSPPPADPTQAQVMMALPLVFTFLFMSFPAGLVLYWTVNNTVSILQQWYITKGIDEAKNKKKK